MSSPLLKRNKMASYFLHPANWPKSYAILLLFSF
ncbi:hypothetical protein SGRA_2863 [Saprospira grandis str. Lewin]|uniref:Uncharacterized protein n=1 Tax=Saprospira grandis (strain Lewin) TaxID=984262 RepID=H6LAJ8_SAPGL|nr:hypothetical protein SGRA_2863 [Saprospira grandis str. Lewin]